MYNIWEFCVFWKHDNHMLLWCQYHEPRYMICTYVVWFFLDIELMVTTWQRQPTVWIERVTYHRKVERQSFAIQFPKKKNMNVGDVWIKSHSVSGKLCIKNLMSFFSGAKCSFQWELPRIKSVLTTTSNFFSLLTQQCWVSNKLARLEATLVRNFNPQTNRLTDSAV